MATGSLKVVNSGLLKALFPPGSLVALPRDPYAVCLGVPLGPETEEILRKPIELA